MPFNDKNRHFHEKNYILDINFGFYKRNIYSITITEHFIYYENNFV